MIDDPRNRRAGLRCPTCNQSMRWSGNPAGPFRLACKPIDLGGWLKETYRVPGPPPPLELEPAPVPDATRAGR